MIGSNVKCSQNRQVKVNNDRISCSNQMSKIIAKHWKMKIIISNIFSPSGWDIQEAPEYMNLDFKICLYEIQKEGNHKYMHITKIIWKLTLYWNFHLPSWNDYHPESKK